MPPAQKIQPQGARKRGGRPWSLVGAFAAASAALAILVVFGDADEAALLDADLCPTQDISSARAVYLVDAHKPLDADLEPLPGKLLRRLTLELDADAELSVFAVGADSAAPRTYVGRICKPYDNAQLQVAGAKDQTSTRRDCDDLPAQIPPVLRDAAGRFCRRRAALERRLDALPRLPVGAPLKQAPLAEALEASLDDLAATTARPATLYVLSDMLHHAPGFSHLDRGARQDHAAFQGAVRRNKGERPSPSGVGVEVFYLPRAGLTDEPGAELAHKRFWRRFFAGTVVSFTDQPTAAAYPSRPLLPPAPALGAAAPSDPVPTSDADDPAAAELAELRNGLADERRKAQQLLDEIAQRQAELADMERRMEEREAEEARRRADDLAALQEERSQIEAERRDLAEETAAAEARRQAEASRPSCPLRYVEGSAVPEYPSRTVNIGSATVAVAFDVDARGRTVDASVHVDAARSSAERDNLDAFTGAAIAVVRQWEFELPVDDECRMRQSSSVTIEFRYE
ncbi:MAG: hypothetical protein OXG82_05445 [Gammaproteobacteria bacterium]|nr:hypothetical protein [Gammaproteobacteria bacterium]